LNPLKQLAGQTAVYGMGTIVPRLLNYLLLTPFYTRVFVQGEYGTITELYAYVAFLMVLLTYGMETAYFRFVENAKNKDSVYTTSLMSLFVTSSVFILLVLLFATPIAGLIRYSSNVEYIIYFAFIIGIDAFSSIPFARLRQQKKATRFAFIKIINVVVNISLNFFFLWLCPLLLKNDPESFIQHIYSPDIGVGYAFIANLIASVVTLILLTPDIFKIRMQFDISLFRNMLIYALPLLVVGLAGMVNEVSDKIFLKYLWSDPETALNQVGIYGACFRLAVLMTLFTQMFRYAAEPFFFAQAKEKNSKQVYADVMKYFVVFGLIIFLVVMLYIDIFKYFIGPDFHEGLFIVPIILFANLFLGIFYNLSVWYKLNNLTRYAAIIALIGAAITVILNVALIPKIGYLGSAWAHFACYLVMMIISYFWGRKHFPIDYDLKRIFLYTTLAITLFAVGHWLRIDSFGLKIFLNTILLFLFLIVVYRFEKSNFSGPAKV
jgi:O-antigen/teichoic acid export membrane protein